MTSDITNTVLLEHMQGMKLELQTEVKNMKIELQKEIKSSKFELQNQISQLNGKVDRGFEDARVHRTALQADLDASIRMLAKHDRKLVRL